jgi:hypothetical protein
MDVGLIAGLGVALGLAMFTVLLVLCSRSR